MLKTIVPLTPARLVCTGTNENKLDTDGDSGISGSRINDRIINLSSTTKKMSFRADFFISEASLAFTRLRKAFIKALILYYFDLKYHIRI